MTGIVLAGGLSSRIGRDKALLPWGDSIILSKIVAQLKDVCDDIVIVRNTPLDVDIPGVRMVADIFKQMGPLAGIHAGLTIARDEYAFVTACDMPYLPKAAIELLLSEAVGYDIVMPATGSDYEPMFSCYSRNCLPAVESLLQRGVRKIIEVLPLVRYKTIARECFLRIDQRIFSNINTQAEYKVAMENVSGKR